MNESNLKSDMRNIAKSNKEFHGATVLTIETAKLIATELEKLGWAVSSADENIIIASKDGRGFAADPSKIIFEF